MKRISIILFTVLLAACGDGGGSLSPPPASQVPDLGTPPEISDLSLSPDIAFFMQGDGTVLVTVELAFFDPDLDLQSIRVEISDGTSLTIVIPGPINDAEGTLTGEFIVSTAELGVLSVEVWLVDGDGQSSNHLTAEFVCVNEADTWLERESGLPHALNDVHWNGWQFLAVGDGGTIMLSADGIAWASVHSGTDVDLNAIAWDGFDYAVVGDKGTVLFSNDSENWTLQYQGPDDISLQAAAYAGWQLIAAGKKETGPDTAFIMSSMDHGQTWAVADALPQSGRSVTDIARGDIQFVATTQIEQFADNMEARVLTSVDGLTWVEVAISMDSVSTHSILYDGSQYLAGGRVGRIYTSPDGINWSELQTPAQTTIFRGVAWSGSIFIADGENEFIGWGKVDSTGVTTSDGGDTWAIFTIDTDYDSRGLAWGNGRFVSVGCAGPEEDCAGLEQNEGAIFATP